MRIVGRVWEGESIYNERNEGKNGAYEKMGPPLRVKQKARPITLNWYLNIYGSNVDFRAAGAGAVAVAVDGGNDGTRTLLSQM